MTWHTQNGPVAAKTDLTPSPAPATYTVGNGGAEVTVGYGVRQTPGREYSTAPVADPQTGLLFKTEHGSPVPAAGPRMEDLVVIDGMPIKVANAIQLGLLDAASLNPTAQAPQAPLMAAEALPEGDAGGAPEGAPSAADSFREMSLHRLSPAAMGGIEDAMRTGEFSEMTTDLMQLEASMPMSELGSVRDAFAAQVMADTGLDEAELEQLSHENQAGFVKAGMELLKTGSTAGFQALANAAVDSSYVTMETAEAVNAWRDQTFPQALIASGIELIDASGAEPIVNIPNHGPMPWSVALNRNLVSVQY